MKLNFQISKLNLRFQINSNGFSRDGSFGHKYLDFANDYAFSIIGKFIFASLIATFRHGREEDEVMGISFKKELVVDRVQVQSAEKKGEENSKLQVIINHIGLMQN